METIKEFSELTHQFSQYKIIERYNPYDALLLKEEEVEELISDFLTSHQADIILPESPEDGFMLFDSLLSILSLAPESLAREKLSQQPLLSFILFKLYPDLFIPYLFRYQQIQLIAFAEHFNIRLPKPPRKTDANARGYYYVELCEELFFFREEHELSPFEFLAFIYDYAPLYIEKHRVELAVLNPQQAWFITDFSDNQEHQLNLPFWECSSEVRQGDILLFFEKGLKSALTLTAQAVRNSVVDPFSKAFDYTYRTLPNKIPEIALRELKQDAYLSAHPMVIKNFKTPSSLLTYEEYNRVIGLIKNKKGDVSKLPALLS